MALISENVLRLEIVFQEENSNRILEFDPANTKQVRVGRSKSNEIVLDKTCFSRVHTTFSFSDADKNWYLTDGNGEKPSVNGTWIYLDCQTPVTDKFKFRVRESVFEVDRLSD